MKAKVSIVFIILFFSISVSAQTSTNSADTNFPYKNLQEVLPGTKVLTWDGNLAAKMLDGAHQFIDEKINESITSRTRFWNRDFSSLKAYQQSVEPNRKRFMKYIGVEDQSQPFVNYDVGLEERNPAVYMQRVAVNNDAEVIAETSKYRVYQVHS